MLFLILLATFIVSLVSLVGLFFSARHLERFSHYFISFSAAALLSVSFFDLMPESFSSIGFESGLLVVFFGVVVFFLLERFIHWHHCSRDGCSSHHKPAGFLSLFGDFLHNFVDGLLIAAAFLIDVSSGFLTAFSVFVHEIPQEVGDFTILIHSGFSKNKALFFNFLSALSAVLGGVVGFFFLSFFSSLIPLVVAFAAGGFLYVSLSDILPDLHKHPKNRLMIFLETLIFLVSCLFFFFFIHLFH